MATEIISRDDARARGLKRFFTGTPCRRGHISERYVADYTCIECTHMAWRRASVKDYDQKHKDDRKKYSKKWRDENRDISNAHSRRWAKEHPEEHAMRARLRRSRQRNAGGSHTVEEIKALLSKQKFKCAACSKRVADSYEVDHIVPLSKGGSNDIRNLQILCISCNRRKNAKDPFVWAQENGRLL